MRITIPAISAGLLIAATAAQASPSFVVHGIPGDGLGLDSSLPVDISVDSECALEDVTFGEVAGPIELPVGTQEIEVFLNDSEDACGGTLAVTGQVDISIAETAIIIAHLDQNGAPTVTRFTADAGPTDPQSGRVAVVHTAKAPPVDVAAALVGRDHPVATIADLKPGEASFGTELQARMYDVSVAGAGAEEPVAEIPFTVDAETSYVVFAVGSLADRTFTVIPVDIDTNP